MCGVIQTLSAVASNFKRIDVMAAFGSVIENDVAEFLGIGVGRGLGSIRVLLEGHIGMA